MINGPVFVVGNLTAPEHDDPQFIDIRDARVTALESTFDGGPPYGIWEFYDEEEGVLVEVAVGASIFQKQHR